MSEIELLSDRDQVRTRPSAYIGEIQNPTSALMALLSKPINDILQGYAQNLWIEKKELQEKSSVKYQYIIADDGRAISLQNTESKATLAQLLITSLNSGIIIKNKSNISETVTTNYSIVNYLSEEFVLYVHLKDHNQKRFPPKLRKMIEERGIFDTDGWYYKLEYHLGLKASEEIVHYRKELNLASFTEKPNTIISMIPDRDIWGTQNCNHVLDFRALKFECPEANIWIDGVLSNCEAPKYTYAHEVKLVNPDKGTKNDFIRFKFTYDWNDDLDDTKLEYAVNFMNVNQGVHVQMFEKAFTRAFEETRGNCNGKVMVGMNLFCCLVCNEPVLSRTNTLTDIPGFPIYNLDRLIQCLKEYFLSTLNSECHYLQLVKAIEEKKQETMNRYKHTLIIASEYPCFTSSHKPWELKDCAAKDRTDCELFVTSYHLNLLRARTEDMKVGIYYVNSVPMNPVNKDWGDLAENETASHFINAIACGIVDYQSFSLDKLRFNKIVLCFSDSLMDSQIKRLLLLVIKEKMPFLLKYGMVYIPAVKGIEYMDIQGLRDNLFDKSKRKLIKVTLGDVDE